MCCSRGAPLRLFAGGRDVERLLERHFQLPVKSISANLRTKCPICSRRPATTTSRPSRARAPMRAPPPPCAGPSRTAWLRRASRDQATAMVAATCRVLSLAAAPPSSGAVSTARRSTRSRHSTP
uniref:Uncharacterized protein n=1 Tax=Steinernema glaseri TaxID=37863 RepID=A0A1I7XWX5_9BILA